MERERWLRLRPWLPELRHVLMFAGLLTRRKGFRTTTIGPDLLRDDRAGTLDALLFRTLFQRLDFGALDRCDRNPGITRVRSSYSNRLRSIHAAFSCNWIRCVSRSAVASSPAFSTTGNNDRAVLTTTC